MRKGLELSSSAVSLFLAFAFHLVINDVVINKKKIKRFKGENVVKYEYRAYAHDEILNLLSVCDRRIKAAILLMSSTGMRIGALLEIKLKHLKRWEIEEQGTGLPNNDICFFPQKTNT